MISVIICTYNRSSVIIDCLNSLLNINDPGCPFEIVVIDNNSQDNTVRQVTEFINKNRHRDIRLFSEKRQGLAFGRNLGIKVSKGSLLVFLDDDAIVDPDYLVSYKKYYDDKSLSCMGSKILPWYRDKKSSIPAWFNNTNWGVLSMLDKGEEVKKVVYPEFPYGGNLAIAKQLFNKFGPFNEEMGRKGSSLNSNMEIEFMLRLQRVKIPIYYVPDAVIYHLVQNDRLNSKFFFRRFYAQGKSDAFLFLKEQGRYFVIKTLPVRLIELLCAPLLYLKRKVIKRNDYFKPILRIFYNIGYFVETTNLIYKS